MKPNPNHNDPKEKHQTSAHLYFNHRDGFKLENIIESNFDDSSLSKLGFHFCISLQTFEETESQTFIVHFPMPFISFTNLAQNVVFPLYLTIVQNDIFLFLQPSFLTGALGLIDIYMF